MGSCCPASLPPTIPSPLQLEYDETNSMFVNSYLCNGRIFEKRLYNWHSIPITTAFRIPEEISPARPYFQVRNAGIKNDNFLVGIITRIAMRGQHPKPWTTIACLCLESHQAEGESGVIYENVAVRLGRGVKRGETVRVSLESNWIDFSVQGVSVHRRIVPKQLRYDEILPYVVLFSEGDRIEFVNAIQPER